MSRRTRVPFEREFVHAYTRGNNRARIFFDEFDYVDWLRMVARAGEIAEWRCHSYCLMPNHYHLLLETSQEGLSRGMRHLNGAFAQRINRRYEGTGHVFEGPYRIELIESEAHLLEVCRYIPRNPIRANLVVRPEDWPWSSYRVIAGIDRRPPPFLTTTFVRALFGRGDAAPAAYRRFVLRGSVSDPDMSRDLVPGRGGLGR